MTDRILALKALNQYRKRDVIPYLGLRYYLDNKAAQSSRWINEVATKVAHDDSEPAYLRTYHYKDREEDGSYKYRDVHLPSPNEALAEVALITELAKHEVFHPKPYVYSYRLADHSDSSGVFIPYFNGLKDRQKSITQACNKNVDFTVLYTDIKKFYPSIKIDDALAAWQRNTENSGLDKLFIDLGNMLLIKQAKVSEKEGGSKGLLTGPIFSHVIANLLLDDIDVHMYELTGGHYWRYVDDIVLVGTDDDIEQWRAILVHKFSKLELELHDGGKDFRVSSEVWLGGEKDFESNISERWISLIANIKRYLISHPTEEAFQYLQQSFTKNNIRIPLIDYSIASKEVTTLEKFRNWLLTYRKWSYKHLSRITPQQLNMQGYNTRAELLNYLDKLLKSQGQLDEYANKRLIPKLRFIAGRLTLLASKQELLDVSKMLSPFPELRFLCTVMECVATRDISDVLKMGTNATQAACQVLRSSPEPVTFTIENYDEIIELSLAVLTLNGIQFDSDFESSPLRSFAEGQGLKGLMSGDDKFLKEVACLHGLVQPRHVDMLDEAFDVDEDLAMDVINQLQDSSHC